MDLLALRCVIHAQDIEKQTGGAETIRIWLAAPSDDKKGVTIFLLFFSIVVVEQLKKRKEKEE